MKRLHKQNQILMKALDPITEPSQTDTETDDDFI